MALINLLPAQVQRQRKIDLLNYYTLLGGMVLVLGVVVLAGLLLLFDQVYRVNLETAKQQKAQAESQAVLNLDVEKKAQGLEKQLEQLQKANSQTTRWATLLTELQALTPPTLSIQAMALKTAAAGGPASAETKTTITGRADSRRTLGQFQIALSQSPYFKNVEIATSTLTGTGSIDYQITTEINFDKLNGPVR